MNKSLTKKLNNLGYMAVKGSFKFGSIYSSQIEAGPWINQSNAYIGVTFQADSLTYYGWICLDTDANLDSIVVKDFAYNDIKNSSIAAGEGDTVSANIHTAFSTKEQPIVYSFNKNVYLHQLPLSGEFA